MNRCGLSIFRIYGLLLAGSLALAGVGCIRDQTPRVLETAYVKGADVPLQEKLGPSAGSVAKLQSGQKVDVLAKRARWDQVRLASGQTGWVHSRFLASSKLFDQFQSLAGETAALPSQGRGVIRREANLHTKPDRNADTFYTLNEKDEVEVLQHRVAERTDRPAPKRGATGAGSSESDAKSYEDWFLVRGSNGRTGWLRESFLDMNPPIEIARYNEGLRVRAWFVLFQEQNNGKVHPWYLWATVHPRPGLPFDYDEIRVFVWDPKKSRYETSYRERNLTGFYPIQVGRSDAIGQAPTFSLLVNDDAGKQVRKNYIMNGRQVKPG